MSSQIKFIVPRRGLTSGKAKVKVESNGYSGVSCIAATSAFLKTMGKVEETVDTPDMYKEVDANVELSN